jgi:hypothetical protein
MSYHDRFKGYSSEEQDFILQLGITCFDNSKLITSQEKEEQYHRKLKDIRDSHKREIEYLREHERELVEEKVAAREKLIEHHTQKQIEYLSKQNETLCEKLKELIVIGQEKSDKTVESLNIVINTVRGISSNSSERGKMGESIAEIELDKYMPSGTTWENTSGEAGKSDIQANIPGIGKIMIDIKNHEKDHGGVPVKDRKKLLRDIDNDSTIIGGILVAVLAKIQSATHCQVIFSDKQKPMVACVLDGDWSRLKDAIEVMRLYSTMRRLMDGGGGVGDLETPEDNEKESGETSMTRPRMIEMCKQIMEGLTTQEEMLNRQRNEIVRQMTAVNLIMSEINPMWNPSIREWLMLKIKPISEGEIIPPKERVNIRELRMAEGAPKGLEVSNKNGRDYIRDALHQNGININTDGTITNARLL